MVSSFLRKYRSDGFSKLIFIKTKSYTSCGLSNHVKFQIEIAKYYLLTYAVNDNQMDTATSPHKTIDKNA